MKKKEKIITFLLCIIVLLLYVGVTSYSEIVNKSKHIYNVYLDGSYLGSINSKDALYELIDKKQEAIKSKYGVDSVYPPNGLEIVEGYSYSTKVSKVDDIYHQIEELQDFTIHGYEISVSASNEHKEYNIYVLDKSVFETAVKDFVLAFIEEDEYNDYINGVEKNLEDVGFKYTDMDILEDITIKETYISIKEDIYQNSNELTQKLLFGFNAKTKNYTVKRGDTINSIADDFELNPKEILIANTKYTNEDNLLTVGDTLTIAYVLPELSFSYSIEEIKKVEVEYNTEIKRDNTKPSSYSEVTVAGVKGISLMNYGSTLVNGKLSSSVELINETVLREKVDQVTVKGQKSYSSSYESFEDIGTGWTWPTISPYIVTSEYGYRELGGGKSHKGIDISGTPWGSNIYAAGDGTVVYVHKGCADRGSYPNSCGSGYGNWVIIEHENDIFTVYAHMLKNIPVNVGDYVHRGDVVGFMGNSGQSTGTHLHFGVSKGNPRIKATYMNPRNLYK